MLLTRRYKFYAAHRNQYLDDKCRNIHGHLYRIRATFDLPMGDTITMLFSDIDALVAPIIEEYDHVMLIDENDGLYKAIQAYDPTLQFKVLPDATSVEILGPFLFEEILRRTKLPLVTLEIEETDSSLLTFHLQDKEVQDYLNEQAKRN